MLFPVLTLVMIFILVTAYKIRTSDRNAQDATKEFWENERRANAVRKQSLDSIPYITVPLEKLPMNPADDERIAECQKRIRSLSEKTIANLSAYSNTDLKLTYGAANLDLLSSYDQNCIDLLRTLTKWAQLLIGAGLISDAKSVLEFGISCKSDVSKHYTLLAEIYKQEHMTHSIESLIETAKSLDSPRSASIVKALNEILQSGHNPE